MPERGAKQDLTKWRKAKNTVVVPAIIEARPAIDKGCGIGNTEIKPGNPDVGFIDAAGIGHGAKPVVVVVNELASPPCMS